MKLWDKGKFTSRFVEEFTTGKDREMDLYLAPYDVIGSLAHVQMLRYIGLLDQAELNNLSRELKGIFQLIRDGIFIIDNEMEDVHTQIEFMLCQKLGETGKKIHTGRSRNDQVLLDIRLLTRDKLSRLKDKIVELFNLLLHLSETNKDNLMPGYTHLQLAMPSSFGLWFGAYAEMLADDLCLIQAAYQLNNQNPLGSAAGYGSSFPLDRQMTTELLGFENVCINSLYASNSRGKTERIVAFAMSNLAYTIAKLANDVILFMSQNFGFLSLPDEFTTGSSIMPHKKNPDLFEIIRGRCNKMQALPFEINLISGNLPTGYFRDYQLLKESYLPAFDIIAQILEATILGLGKLIVRPDILKSAEYDTIFTVDKLNRIVQKGISFREAYKMVAGEVESGTFQPEKEILHTHLGSIGNLANHQIRDKFKLISGKFDQDKVNRAINKLLEM
jgi:argininosuccinate lyase